MTRVIRSDRIGGRAPEARRYARGTAMAAALIASVAVLAMSGVSSLTPIGSVIAQTPGTSGPVSLGDLFKALDSPDLKDSADGVLNAAIVNASSRVGMELICAASSRQSFHPILMSKGRASS
jgi:hypothetical protein